MAANKPSVPKGTRDFSPAEMAKRNYIFDTIKTVFRKYGYQEIQTPSMENLETLTGKYGEEGDKLIFKILDSGEFLEKTTTIKDLQRLLQITYDTLNQRVFHENVADLIQKLANDDTYLESIVNKEKKDLLVVEKVTDFVENYLTSKNLLKQISEKALRYDLTVPFARYVVSHQSEITFPFKRFQVQPVWRADRPQKGRYREFYQCDADVVGSDSLLNEAEFILIYDEALSNFGLKDFTIKINNRKILYGIAESIGKADMLIPMTVAIDKLDKIGRKGVIDELEKAGFSSQNTSDIIGFLYGENFPTIEGKIQYYKTMFGETSQTGLKGIEEIEAVFTYLKNCTLKTAKLELDITLARGLNYYTGAIFEVKTNEVAMGSVGGGGRYDDLTGMFGLKGLTGAGISFGADRIYDVLEELKLFPEDTTKGTQVLICCFDKEFENYGFQLVNQLRQQEIRAELYPPGAKIKKQLDYANNKNIQFTIMIGSEEMQSGLLSFKNMQTGEQQKLSVEEILEKLTA